MKVVIPEELQGKELYDFLIENKSALIAEKKCLPKPGEAFSHVTTSELLKSGVVVKSESGEDVAPDTVKVKFVGNATNWCDSHMDVAIPGCYDKTIKERKNSMVHLHDHIHRLDAEVGDIKRVYTKDIPLTELGINKAGSVECMVFESEVKKDYNEKVFNKYKSGKVKQHSIGLWYVKLELAVNDSDYPKEKEVWDKYIGTIVNKKMVEEKGYFWALLEIKVMEVSAVLFGSNELTPTLSTKANSDDEPGTPTQQEPSTDTQDKSEGFDFNNYLQTVKIFNNAGSR